MKQFFLKMAFLFFVKFSVMCTASVNGQTAITATNTTYTSTSSGSTYTASGATGSPLAGSTYTYKFGNVSGTANNNRQLNNFTAGGSLFSFAAIPGQIVKIRRVNNSVVTGIRGLRYSEGTMTGTTVNVYNDYNDDMEVFFNGNTVFNSGSDNLFTNQGDGNGNNNNIERMDIIFPNGLSSADNSKIGFPIFDRGAVNNHDPVKVAVILSVDGAGNPTSYSAIKSISSANYGAANALSAANYIIFRRDFATDPKLKVSTTNNQAVGGVFVKLSDFGITNNTNIYGYSIIPNDFTGSTSADIINYTNATLYPTNTSSASNRGGIDLACATGLFQSSPVLNKSITGTVLNDINGMTNSLIDGTGNFAGGINAILINNSGIVVAATAVAADGTYTFGNVSAGNYGIILSTNSAMAGAAAPAASLPAGWVNTAEGLTASGDGTVNGVVSGITFSGGNLSGVNFGIERLPATPSSITAAIQLNPGGTLSAAVPATTFGGTDYDGGIISNILISSFPTNATSFTINGTTYSSVNFPATGVNVPASSAGQPTQSISVDPVNGAVTVVITYFTIDNAGKKSAASATASVPFSTVTISGNVLNDVNGLSNGSINGTGTNAGGINAILANSSNVVVASSAVAAAGTYSFTNVNSGTYTVRISTTAATVGATVPTVVLPTGWVNTGEGTTTAGDGTVNGIVSITVVAANISTLNFGIEQPPLPANNNAPSVVNPGGTTSVTVPTATFGGTEFSGGTISSVLIKPFPSNVTSITINRTTYTAANFPAAGVRVTTNTAGQPRQTIRVDPVNGAVTVVISYFVTDNAGKQSATNGTANISFTTLTVSGNVYNDVNGMTSGGINGTGTNAGGLNALLVNSTGFEVATAAVTATGTYSLTGINGGSYTVRLSTSAGTIGAVAPVVSLPSGWVNTGEGTTVNGDGTPNGITNAFTLTTTNKTNVNFGIEQPPVAAVLTATSQVNPGGTTSAVVPASTFGGTEFSGGTITSLLIKPFPTNATTITINGTIYTAANFPAAGVTTAANTSGQPTATINIDPVDGLVTVLISYFLIDNAGKQSIAAGSASMPFTTLTVSGNVYNDVNGLTNNLVDGTGTNGGGINAILVNSAGNTAGYAAVSATGAYSITGVNGGTYTVRISTSAPAIGSAAPAVALPTGWVNTGEGTTSAGDGAVNGISNNFTLTTTSVTNVNFGMEQPPVAAALTATSQVNPGGTVSVLLPVSTFGGTEFSGGTISNLIIKPFPTNITSITINGNTYTSANFPAAGITLPVNAAGQPTQTISIDPIEGAVTAVVSYVLTDNAGKQSTTAGTASAPFTTLTVTGNVLNDVNGLTNNLVDGTGTNAGGINAILVNTAGNVTATSPVAADGTYSIGDISSGTYSVRISTSAATVGAAAPAVALPSGWVSTGEGTSTAGDGTVNGITNTFVLTTGNLTSVNFGIEQPPVPSVLSATSQLNPGGTTTVTVPAVTFASTEFSGGIVSNIRISAFPTNTSNITINGTTYTAASFPAAGVTIPTNATGQPTQSINIDPVDGIVTAVITYFATDNAGKQSLTSGKASMPFSLTISGNVFNDINGLTNSLVDGTGTNGGGIYAIVVNNAGNVAATTAVAADGTYSINGVVGGTYTVRISTTAGTVGAAAPAVVLPAGWVNTGEGTTAAGDGTVNGITNTITLTTTNISNVNFGLEQPPVVSILSAASQVNPGGTTNVTVPASIFGATEFSGGIVSSIKIAAFPTNTTTITINGISYTSASFPAAGVSVPTNAIGQPTQTITIDPVNGIVTAVITYFAIDNAGKQSLTSGTTSLPFALTVSGNVFNDINGATNSLVDGTGTNAGGINAILVNNSGNVAATTPVAANGIYNFSGINAGTYTIRISTSTGTVGSAAPAVSLPAGWVNTGEGTSTAGDGVANGVTNAFTLTSTSIANVNFGIEQLPLAATITAVSQVNLGGTISMPVVSTSFSGTEFSGGIISSLLIKPFPANATSITINGINYTAASFPAAGVTTATNVSGEPVQSISLDPIDGAVTILISYYVIDNAGMQSMATGTAYIPFHCAIPGLWTGAVNNNWNNPANWCSNSIPDASTNVVIPAGISSMPVITAPAIVHNIYLQPGSMLDISSDSFTITGTVSGTGKFAVNAASTLSLTGSSTGNAGTLYFSNGKDSIGYLHINESGTNASISIGTPLYIIKVLTVTKGILNTNDSITLISNAAGTARVAAIDCNLAAVNGDLIVERYISGRRAWRMLSVPVGGSQTIRNAWQENTTAANQNPFPGYGTHITGGTAANGFDQTLTNNPSIRIYTPTLFSFTSTALASTNLPLNNQPGYFILVRGDRSTDLTQNAPLATGTVLRTKGPLRTCAQTTNTIEGPCNLVGNPYPSPIDFTLLTRTNIPNRFFLWDPYLNGVGGYQTFDSSNNYIPIPGGGSYGNSPNTIIQSGQAFLVQGSVGGGSLVINENAKVDSAGRAYFRPASLSQKLNITLNTVNSNSTITMNDGLLAMFNNSYAAASDEDDARKMTNVDEIFGLIREGKLMCIEKRPVPIAEDTLFIKTYRLKVKNYQFQIQPANFDGAVTAFLEDAYLHTITNINLFANTTVNFSVTADVASSNVDRFRIVFKPLHVLPVKFVNLKAKAIDQDINVSWTANTSGSETSFEIEKSTDGQHFTSVGIVASGSNNGAADYNWLDKNVSESVNYYRIKATENNSTAYYSVIVSIRIKQAATLLQVYPNPVTENNFSIQVNDLPKGLYSLKLLNATGQVVFTKQLNHNGGKMQQLVNTGNAMVKGAYHLLLSSGSFTISKTIEHF